MEKTTKKLITGIIIIALLIGAGYAAFKVYNWAVEDATRRIKTGVKEGVGEGVGEGFGSAMNPLNWPSKLVPGK